MSSTHQLFKLFVNHTTTTLFSRLEDEASSSSGSIVDLHTIDLESQNFKTLPAKEKYDLLLELKETRKMNSWGKLHELPKKSDNFSDFQVGTHFFIFTYIIRLFTCYNPDTNMIQYTMII